MSTHLKISYLYTNPQVRSRLDMHRSISGEPEKVVIAAIVKGWLNANREHYLDIAARDCVARGLDFNVWARIVADGGFIGLDRKHYLPRPLQVVDKLNDTKLQLAKQKSFLNHLTFGTMHLVLFKTVQYYARESLIDTVSKIVQYHIDTFWGEIYAPQIKYENYDNWVLPAVYRNGAKALPTGSP